VEIYQQTILDGMKIALFNNLKRSVVRYHAMTRSEWLMHKKPEPNPNEVYINMNIYIGVYIGVYIFTYSYIYILAHAQEA
jgi:hypothetical protein